MNRLDIEGMTFKAPTQDMEPEAFIELQNEWKHKLNTIHKGKSFLNIVIRTMMLADAITSLKLGSEDVFSNEECRDGAIPSSTKYKPYLTNSLLISKQSQISSEHEIGYFNPTREQQYPAIVFSDYKDDGTFNITRTYSNYDEFRRNYEDLDPESYLDKCDLEINKGVLCLKSTNEGKLSISIDGIDVFQFNNKKHRCTNAKSFFEMNRSDIKTEQTKPEHTTSYLLLQRLVNNDKSTNDVKNIENIEKFTPGKWMNLVYELYAQMESRLTYVTDEIKAVDKSLEEASKRRALTREMNKSLTTIQQLGDLGF